MTAFLLSILLADDKMMPALRVGLHGKRVRHEVLELNLYPDDFQQHDHEKTGSDILNLNNICAALCAKRTTTTKRELTLFPSRSKCVKLIVIRYWVGATICQTQFLFDGYSSGYDGLWMVPLAASMCPPQASVKTHRYESMSLSLRAVSNASSRNARPKNKKVPHRQPGTLRGSSSPLSPFQPARVVRPN